MGASFERLWAKSCRADEALTPSMYLLGHLQDVFAAARCILAATAEDQLSALGLDSALYKARFYRCVLLAAAVHDLGKANDHFQEMLERMRNVRVSPQGLRHEWVTILMLQALKAWLLPAVDGSEIDFAIVEWAVAGHHPAPTHESPPKNCPDGAGVEIKLLMGHKDWVAIIDWLGTVFDGVDRKHPVGRTISRTLAESNHVFGEISRLWRSARRTWEERIRNTDDRKFAAAVKDCLIAADIAGSALPKAQPNNVDRWEWITKAFSNGPKQGDVEKIYRIRLGDDAPREFQRRVAESSDPVTLVRAGCGTGKTVAAYMWAARNHSTRRLYFCYPTTGTATEGFKDYLFEPDGELGELGARLFHSRRDIDFEVILGTGPDAETPEQDAAAKLESLEAWATPIVSCTVDTVLGVIQNNKRGLFAWPALAQSALVFDEIHSYDDRLFGALLRFLIDLPGLPVLLMTASLPRAREDALRAALAKRNAVLTPIAGPRELEKLPRYHKVTAPENDPLSLIRKELETGGKVLWVCNTVGRVMDAADRAQAAGLSPLIYHSRFRYIDRVERHKEVIRAFTPEHRRPALAACSQVAELSLDLKGCTLLVTDLASIPALIQRFGRLNRQAKPGDATRGFIVVEPDKSAPYKPEELQLAREWLGNLSDDGIRQSDLSAAWDQSANDAAQLINSAWLDGGPITEVTELREESPGISVLLREDADRMQASRGRDHDVGRYVIPMLQPPPEMNWRLWSKFKGIPIAEPGFIVYGRERGAKWQQPRNPPPRII